MRTILGELYGDRKYLQKFQNNLPGGKAKRDLTLLADEGLEFLRERTMFWDSLGPLPPPQVPKRSNMKERSFFFGSTESLQSIASNKSPRDAVVGNSHEQNGVSPRPKPKVFKRTKKKKMEVVLGLERDCATINFSFKSLKESRSASRIDNSPDGGPNLPILREIGRARTKVGRATFVGIDNHARDRKRELTRFINKEMDVIDEAFKTGEFSDCKHKAQVCLQTIADLEDENINKSEVMASLHSCIGNASIAMNDFENALKHHMVALSIGENENLHEVINRALGHLGRMYIIQKKFNKALEVFARKAPTVTSSEEVAQVFHEIGNCFLALGHLDYARDCGKKALRAAMDADIHYFKFQSWVLIAVSESRMKHHDEAFKAFQSALELARQKDDQESITVILFAMEHLSKTITSIMKKREMLSERLTSRSKTQTLIDLNKRPRAAKMKKRKKRMRREQTTLDDNDLSRQNTMLDPDRSHEDETFHHDHQYSPRHHHQHESTPAHSPRVELLRGNTMFECPRELEPFGDPHIRSRKRLSQAGLYKRHGTVDNMDHSRSGDTSGFSSNLDYSRERTGSKLDMTPRANSKLDSSREFTRSHSKIGTPRDGMDQSNASRGEGSRTSPHRAGLSPLKRHDVSGVLSEASTPREGRGSGRSYVLMTDRTGMSSQNEGHEQLDSHREGAPLPLRLRRGSHDSRMSEGKGSPERLRHDHSHDDLRSHRRRSVDESRGNVTFEEDITGAASDRAVLGSRNNDLTPGRLVDLSATFEPGDGIASTNSHHDVNEEGNVTARTGHSADGQETPKARESPTKHVRYSKMSIHTPGRFTSESYFEEDEYAVGTSADATKSFELESVSRQQNMRSRGGILKHTQHESNVEKDQEEVKDVEENIKKESNDDNGKVTPLPLERQSSKVSLRGRQNEETVVTLETTKPYRVSSAASERASRSARNENREDDITPTPTNQDNKEITKAKEEKTADTGDRALAQPEITLSPRSGVTTGSGWEGDVSMESPVVTANGKSPRGQTRTKHRQKRIDDTLDGKSVNSAKDDLQTTAKSTGSRASENLDNTVADVTLNSEYMKTEAANDSPVSSLAAKAVREEVLRNTSDAVPENQEYLQFVKEAHREQKHAHKIRREARDLEDIQSLPYSSNADLRIAATSTMKDPDLSASLPVSEVTTLGPVDGQSQRLRPAAPTMERPESEEVRPSSVEQT